MEWQNIRVVNIYLLIEYDYLTKVSENYLKRKEQTYDLMLHEMSLKNSQHDELVLLVLAQICNYHIMVDAKAMNWTMLNIPREGIAHAQHLAMCDLHLVYMGHNLFAELVKQTFPLMNQDQTFWLYVQNVPETLILQTPWLNRNTHTVIKNTNVKHVTDISHFQVSWPKTGLVIHIIEYTSANFHCAWQYTRIKDTWSDMYNL